MAWSEAPRPYERNALYRSVISPLASLEKRRLGSEIKSRRAKEATGSAYLARLIRTMTMNT